MIEDCAITDCTILRFCSTLLFSTAETDPLAAGQRERGASDTPAKRRLARGLLRPYPPYFCPTFSGGGAMRKLKLNLDDLAVEAFDTAAAPEPRGTVEGNEEFTYFCTPVDPCTGGNGTSCNWSRCYTCAGSCENATPMTFCW
jgi:hypothetical protein